MDIIEIGSRKHREKNGSIANEYRSQVYFKDFCDQGKFLFNKRK